MSINQLSTSVVQHALRRHSDGGDLHHAQRGQEVTVRIVAKLSDGRYSATIGDGRYVVASNIPFEVGQTLRATVSALGGMVELKMVAPGQYALVEFTPPETPASAADSDALATLQSRYKVTLAASERQCVQRLADRVADSEAMNLGAFFLHRIGQEIGEAELRALYGTQVWSESARINLQGREVSALLKGAQQGNQEDIAVLSRILADAFEASAAIPQGASIAQAEEGTVRDGATSQSQSFSTPDGAGKDAEQLQALAHTLLNMQDSGSLAYHYGSLPVMIGGQMMELDMVLFRERPSAHAHRPHGVRKLVMTLKTETLGRVEIVAESIDAVLSVAIGTQSPQATELLAGHAQEVRDLVQRLGWKVDSVNYRLSTETPRAAQHLVRHVVRSGSLDAVV